MNVGLLLIIIGIVVAVLVHLGLGVLVILAGLLVILLPQLRG